MIILKRTDSENSDFQVLVSALDKDLAIRNGETNAFFIQFNKIDLIRNVVVAYENDQPIGCGAIKEYDSNTMEIKRMFVRIERRGKGIASIVLQELENWAKELGYNRIILETGDKMPEAINLYNKCNFKITPNFGQYVNITSSICFEKEI